MNRVKKIIVKNNKELKNLCWLSKNLYNYANYCIRQSFTKTGVIPNEFTFRKKVRARNQVDYRALPATVSEETIRLLYKNWKSFFASIKDYKKNPNKYCGRPKMPQYKDKDGQNMLIFYPCSFRVKNGYIHFVKNIIPPMKAIVDNIIQVRVIPKPTCHVVELVYKKEPSLNTKVNQKNVLSIDLGLNNLCTCITNTGKKPFIINGKPLKAINQYFNKERAKYMSFVGDKGFSRRCAKATLRRNNQISNYLHHVSKYIINYCVAHDIGTIVIGHNDGWKQEVNLGKKTNQHFVNIPFNTLIQQLEYKGEENGIKVISTEESYTSKVDHFAKETMEHHENYLGKRVKRGLFMSSTKQLINADINGAIGIARKVLGDKSLSQFKGNLTPERITLKIAKLK